MGMYCHFIHLNLNIVHFCYFQNTFPFVSTFRQTDDIRNKRRKNLVEQGIVFPMKFVGCFFFPGHRKKRKSTLEITKMYYFYIHIMKLFNKT